MAGYFSGLLLVVEMNENCLDDNTYVVLVGCRIITCLLRVAWTDSALLRMASQLATCSNDK